MTAAFGYVSNCPGSAISIADHHLEAAEPPPKRYNTQKEGVMSILTLFPSQESNTFCPGLELVSMPVRKEDLFSTLESYLGVAND